MKRYRLLTVYQDGQTTTSEYYGDVMAKCIAASIIKQKGVTYCEVLDMTNGKVVFEHHRSYQFKPNTYRR